MVEEFEIAIVLGTLSLFGASMYQAHLMRSEKKLNQKPVFAFTLSFGGDKLNLNCTNIGNGLAKNIEFIVKTQGEASLKPELKVTRSGLAKGDHFTINNWRNPTWVGIGYYDFDCEISGSCRDIFNGNHWIYEKLHFDAK